jgi:hypothetical protein
MIADGICSDCIKGENRKEVNHNAEGIKKC